jgi:hypothetical protein
MIINVPSERSELVVMLYHICVNEPAHSLSGTRRNHGSRKVDRDHIPNLMRQLRGIASITGDLVALRVQLLGLRLAVVDCGRAG